MSKLREMTKETSGQRCLITSKCASNPVAEHECFQSGTSSSQDHRQELSVTIICPTCRAPCSLPPGGVTCMVSHTPVLIVRVLSVCIHVDHQRGHTGHEKFNFSQPLLYTLHIVFHTHS